MTEYYHIGWPKVSPQHKEDNKTENNFLQMLGVQLIWYLKELTQKDQLDISLMMYVMNQVVQY